MSKIHRPDWSPEGGDRSLVNTSLPGTTVGGRNIVVTDYPGADAVLAEPVDTMSDARLDRAEDALELLLDEQPELEALPVEDLPADVRAAIAEVLADYGHLRDGRLVDRVYGKLTLAQAAALDDWLCGLPDELFEGDE